MIAKGHYSSSVTMTKNLTVLLDIVLRKFPSTVWNTFFTLLKDATAPFTLSASAVLVKRMNTGFWFPLKNHILKRGYKQTVKMLLLC